MNKARQLLFLVLFPFFPFWVWILSLFTATQIEMFLTLALIPISLYLLIIQRQNVPKYLFYFILFTIYHLCSVFINNLVPSYTNGFKFILSDMNVFACLMFFIIENTNFEDRFIQAMNRNILFIVIVSLFVSLIQFKHPSFFVSPNATQNTEGVTHLSQNRIFSIYSWSDLNSLGISFPILIAIMLSFFSKDRRTFPIIILSGIAVSFLSKARYVMLSAIIVISQLFFLSKITLRKKFYIILIFIGIVIVLIGAAKVVNYNIQQVIDDRILEKSTNLGSLNARVISYYVFLTKFPEHPIFGVGPEVKQDVVRLLGGSAPMIHVGYLSYLYFYGLVGCFFLFLSMFYLLRDAWIVGKTYQFWGGFYGLLSFYAASATLIYFYFNEMGIILVVIYLRYYIEKASLKLSTSE